MTKDTERFYGSFLLILHSHIPYVLYHDEIGENWLFEAVAECYIPLLSMLKKLVRQGISPKVSISLSPILIEQLKSSCFIEKFRDYCRLKMELAKKDKEYFRNLELHMHYLARLWKKFYYKTLSIFEKDYHCNLIDEFKGLQDEGHIEILTTAATHGYLPLLREDTSIQAQIKMAVQIYEQYFDKKPEGFWLPECGYRPGCFWAPPAGNGRPGDLDSYVRRGLEEFLYENGIRYFVVDNEQLNRSHPHDIHKSSMDTYYIGNNPVTILVRDYQLSEQIWDFRVGYPGNGTYLDFHKRHGSSGLRYWKITQRTLDMAYKHLYYPRDVKNIISEQSDHYKWLIKKRLKAHHYYAGRPAVAVCAFDTELFGHWWFEGGAFLYRLIRLISEDPEIRMLTCKDCIKENPAYNRVYMPESSWGAKYTSETWFNGKTQWIWKNIYRTEQEIRYLATHFRPDNKLQEILRQIIRESMLLQSSDWQFMITNNHTKDYAENRVLEHFENFNRLAQLAWNYIHNQFIDDEDWHRLNHCQKKNNIFKEPEIMWYK